MAKKKAEGGGGSKSGQAKFAAAVGTQCRQSGADAVRRRVEAQRTRLARAAQRALGTPAALLDVHLDGAATLAEHALEGDELAVALRLEHLAAVHAALAQGGTDGAPLSALQRAAAAALHAPLVLALLDEGDAAQARLVLDAAERAAQQPPARDRTALLYSRALVEFVDGGAHAGGEEGLAPSAAAGAAAAEREPAPAVRGAADAALRANPYVGVFLAHLDLFARLIEPELAAAAVSAMPVGADGGRRRRPARADGAGGREGEEGESEQGEAFAPRGPLEGSLEEALAYVSVGISPWLDFAGGEVERLFSGRLEACCADMEWPPRCCSAGGARLQAAFVHAAALAAEQSEEEGEEGAGGEARTGDDSPMSD